MMHYQSDYALEVEAFQKASRTFEAALARYHRAKAAMFEAGNLNADESMSDEDFDVLVEEQHKAVRAIYQLPVSRLTEVHLKLAVWDQEERDNDVNELVSAFLHGIDEDLRRVDHRDVISSLLEREQSVTPMRAREVA